MADYILAVLMVGFAVSYFVELVDIGFVLRRTINMVLPIPLSIGGLFLLGYWNKALIVLVPATIFVALYIGKQLNKPSQVINPRLPRL
jgi:hypothetical protein